MCEYCDTLALKALKEKPVKTYSIVRHFESGEKKIINVGLTFNQAKAHCNNPETSSRTGETQAAKSLTAEKGPWFDAFSEENNDCEDCDSCCGCC